jgi:hypothetical protein
MILELEIIDCSPPFEAGIKRDVTTFPNGFPTGKFQGFKTLGNIHTAPIPDLDTITGEYPSKDRAALRWYSKGLAAQFDIEKFILFWLVLEILVSEMGIKKSVPYVASCGHEIPCCPICNKPTSRILQGERMKSFLESLGLNRQDSIALWEMRQMLHGTNNLDAKTVQELAGLKIKLEIAALNALKIRKGLLPNELPVIAHSSLIFQTQMGVDIVRETSEIDILIDKLIKSSAT